MFVSGFLFSAFKTINLSVYSLKQRVSFVFTQKFWRDWSKNCGSLEPLSPTVTPPLVMHIFKFS